MLIIAAAVLLALGSWGVSAAEDLVSTPAVQPLPENVSGEGLNAPAAPTAAPLLSESFGPTAPALAVIGLNIKGSELNVDSGFIPPDTMGAVGPNHIAEMINGQFGVYNKTTGTEVFALSLDGFWTNAGLTIPNFNDVCQSGSCSVSGGPCKDSRDCVNNFTYDPRIVYDPSSGRWFASSLDVTNPSTGNNNIYVARSDTDDPTGVWKGVMFLADSVGAVEFHDYDTLAVNADGLFICTNDFNGGGNKSCYSIPKANLTAATPSIANMTRFEATPAGLPSVDGSVQAALDFGPSNGRAPLLGASGGHLRRSNIFGAGAAGATLGTVASISGDPGHSGAPAARQPSPAPNIENVTPRLVANVVKQGKSLWAVHAVQGSFSNSAVRWYEIDEATDTMLQTGLIEDATQDFHEPSIAVNEFGKVVIGYTCSGPHLFASACVSAGETVGGVTTFEAPRILAAGAGCYYQDYGTGRNRWGDYSATVMDPLNSCTFWTFQEFVAAGADCNTVGPSSPGGNWGIQITELTFDPPVVTIPGDVNFGDTCVNSSSTSTLDVCNTTGNTGPCANLVVDAITSSNAQFSVTTPSSGYPVVISPDFCFPFQVRFSPSSAGLKSAILTVQSNDPANPSVTVQARGAGTQQEIATIIANSGSFGDVCVGSFKDLNLTISNSGGCDLSVNNISSSSPEFKIPSVTVPIIIHAGDSLQVPIRFQPTTPGPKTAAITVSSNAPTSPSVVSVSGNAPTGSIRAIGSTDFGDVCAGTQAEKTVSVCNVGTCNLGVTSAAFSPACPDFTIINNPFPAPVSPDSCLNLTIRFTPTSAGPKTCTLVIMSDDPNMPVITETVTADTPTNSIDVSPDQGFPPTVIQSVGACQSSMPFPISNTGTCNLKITNVLVGGVNGSDFSLSGLPSFPIILEPGHVAGEGDLEALFKPAALDRDRTGTLTVTYESDPITHATTSVTRNLCGEGVRTGARVLVRASGVPLAMVERIHLQRMSGNRNKDLLDTADVAKDLPLQTVTPAAPCSAFQFHREYGTVSNPIQLAPGSYVVTVSAIVNGKKESRTVGFDVNTCGFNPTIIVDF